MTPQEIRLVRQSWEQVKPQRAQAASLFYNYLFDFDPMLRPLFRGDMVVQGQKLMTMITVVVNGLDRLDEILPLARELGQAHVGYGVRTLDYAAVGQALIWTLEQGLGSGFTPEVRAAWVKAYEALSGAMLSACEQPPRAHQAAQEG